MRWGQHFLIDNNIAERQINYASVSKNDSVLEIGSGHGILTKKLSKKAKNVIVIEIDKKLISYVENLDNIEIFHANVLELDLSPLKFNKVVSNLPYDIAAPFTFQILEQKIDVAVLMYQKEFADRLVAKPGDKNYSRLTVSSYLKGKWQILENVKPEAFKPKPKVYSSLVRFIPSPFNIPVSNKQVLDRLLRVLFSHRRKNIRNALLCEKIFTKQLIDTLPYGDIKVDQLSPSMFVDMANRVMDYDEKQN